MGAISASPTAISDLASEPSESPLIQQGRQGGQLAMTVPHVIAAGAEGLVWEPGR